MIRDTCHGAGAHFPRLHPPPNGMSMRRAVARGVATRANGKGLDPAAPSQGRPGEPTASQSDSARTVRRERPNPPSGGAFPSNRTVRRTLAERVRRRCRRAKLSHRASRGAPTRCIRCERRPDEASGSHGCQLRLKKNLSLSYACYARGVAKDAAPVPPSENRRRLWTGHEASRWRSEAGGANASEGAPLTRSCDATEAGRPKSEACLGLRAPRVR